MNDELEKLLGHVESIATHVFEQVVCAVRPLPLDDVYNSYQLNVFSVVALVVPACKALIVFLLSIIEADAKVGESTCHTLL